MKAVCTRQAIVWDAIERLAFRPQPKDHNTWLSLYERSLASIWGRQAVDIFVRHQSCFEAKHLGLLCEYNISSHGKYGATIYFETDNQEGKPNPTCWHLHVDPEYLSRCSFYKPDPRSKYPRPIKKDELEHDVESILNGMIFHPRAHAHGDEIGIQSVLEAPPALEPKEIRLGGGIENGFVFLTHLRYQLCLLSNDARQEEKTRLIQLFTRAIHEGWLERGRTIPAGELFGLKT